MWTREPSTITFLRKCTHQQWRQMSKYFNSLCHHVLVQVILISRHLLDNVDKFVLFWCDFFSEWGSIQWINHNGITKRRFRNGLWECDTFLLSQRNNNNIWRNNYVYWFDSYIYNWYLKFRSLESRIYNKNWDILSKSVINDSSKVQKAWFEDGSS